MRFLKIFLLISFCVTLWVSCKEEKAEPVKSVEVAFKKEGELQLIKNDSIINTIDIEIADNEYETQTGLMYRNSMKDLQGMLFIFPDERPRSFYMKNTRISLDIIYINADQNIVSIQKNAKPYDESSLPSEGAAQYVLEINGGLSDQWQLEVGNRIAFTKSND